MEDRKHLLALPSPLSIPPPASSGGGGSGGAIVATQSCLTSTAPLSGCHSIGDKHLTDTPSDMELSGVLTSSTLTVRFPLQILTGYF